MTKPEDLEHPVLADNIRTLLDARARFESSKSRAHRIADAITAFAGSIGCIVVHALLLFAWLAINSGWIPGVQPFDPPPYVLLATIASVEAIFLSTFVLVSQNRMQELAERRSDLNLQISLLAEREATTVLSIVDELAKRLGVQHGNREEMDELKRVVTPGQVLDRLETMSDPKR